VRYLVRCLRCDRAFWQDDRAGPVPVHAPWDRRRVATGHPEGRCSGGERSGYWIAEGEGPLTDWPRG
jgi:hypothetical protein